MMLKTAQRYPISPEFVIKCATGSTNVYKVHIMQALIENGFADRFYGDLYKELFTEESETNVLANPQYEDVFKILKDIHEAGGIAVLTKPQECKNKNLVDELVENGLDGIEVYTPGMPEDAKQEYIKYAKKNKILATGGSGFKGLYNERILTIGECDLPDEAVQELNSYKAKRRKAERKKAQEEKAE